MVHLSFCLLVIVLVSLAHTDLFSGFASARPASNAISALLGSNATESITVTSETAAAANLQLRWMSYEAPFHEYNFEYVHNIYLTVDTTYQGMLVYYARGVRKHCHDDGVWCVKHGDSQSPEMTIWYKGLEDQHGNWTVDCGENCKMYYDDV